MTTPPRKQRKPRSQQPVHPYVLANLKEWPIDATPQQLDELLGPQWRLGAAQLREICTVYVPAEERQS